MALPINGYLFAIIDVGIIRVARVKAAAFSASEIHAVSHVEGDEADLGIRILPHVWLLS